MLITWDADAYVLVQQWKTSSLLGLVAAMISACMTGMVYELMGHASHRWNQPVKLSPTPTPRSGNRPKRSCVAAACCKRLAVSCLYTLHLLVSYGIMLLLMTYNAWVIMSAILGSALGYFFFGPWFRYKQMSRRIAYLSSKRSTAPLLKNSYSEARDASSPESASMTPMTEVRGRGHRNYNNSSNSSRLSANHASIDEHDIDVVLGFTSLPPQTNLDPAV